MKTALTLMSVPYGISFLSGVFDWYIDDGLLMLFGLSMLIGIGMAWYYELKK